MRLEMLGAKAGSDFMPGFRPPAAGGKWLTAASPTPEHTLITRGLTSHLEGDRAGRPRKGAKLKMGGQKLYVSLPAPRRRMIDVSADVLRGRAGGAEPQ